MAFCYSASKRFLQVANDGVCEFIIKNPYNSGIITQLCSTASSEGKSYIDSYVGFTYSDIGTIATPVIRDSTVSVNKTEIYYNPIISNHGIHRVEDILFGGEGNKTVGATAKEDIITRIIPGTEILLCVQNKSGSNKDMCISVYWDEATYTN